MLREDGDDEWFFSSINRYQELIMFDTGDPVRQIELVDMRHVCILSEKSPNNRVISMLSLPSKMTKDSPSHVAKQSGDMKIRSGCYPKSCPSQIMAIYESDKLVSSQEDVKGVALYNLKKEDSDQIELDSTLEYPVANPCMALIAKDRVVMTKFTNQPCLVGDLNSECVESSLQLEDTNDSIKPACIDQNVIALSFKKSGKVVFFDRRTSSVEQEFNVSESSVPSWEAFADYEFHKAVPSSNIYFLAKTGHFKGYDLRDLKTPFAQHQIPYTAETNDMLRIRFNPDNKDAVSISGFDANVYLYNVKHDMTELFTHDGHPMTEMCAKETLVSDHVWYDFEFVISGASNNSINCWVANVDLNSFYV